MRKVLSLVLVLGVAMLTQAAAAEPSASPETLKENGNHPFSVASRSELIAAGIPKGLIGRRHGKPVTVTFEEAPPTRWPDPRRSYPRFVAEALYALDDPNAYYIGKGQFQVTSGPRRVLVEALVRLRSELLQRDLVLNLITLSRDDEENNDAEGDPSSDHLIGLAFDASVTVVQCGKRDDTCITRTRILRSRPLEQQLRIFAAAHVVGIQQLNLYGKVGKIKGQSIHIGMSPFRNGAAGETVGKISAEGFRRIGYGNPQKGRLGALTPKAARYVGIGGVKMKDVFEKVLRNDPPAQYEKFYDAVRTDNMD